MTLKTLENALDVLSYFTVKTPEWGLRDLARTMNMNHTVLNRILKTYETKRYLVQNENTKKYSLGFKFLEFSSVIKEKMKLSDFVLPVMKELAERVDEAVFLTLLDGYEGVTIEIAECSQPVQYTVSIGTRTPLYVGASCKVIAAFLPKEMQLEIIKGNLEAYTKNTMISPEMLLAEFDEIREKEWSHTRGEYTEAVTGIGVPLYGESKKVIGSLTIAGPTYRIPTEKVEGMLRELQRSSQIIQRYFVKFGSSSNFI